MQTDTQAKEWSPPAPEEMQRLIKIQRKMRETERQVWSIHKEARRLQNADNVARTSEHYLRLACAAQGVTFNSFHCAYLRMKAEGAAQALADYGITWPPPDDLTL